MIPNNDPVRLLNACVEGMDLSELYQTYTSVPKNLATPKQLFKVVVYSAVNRIYSSRKIEAACRQNINFMYLLEGKAASRMTAKCSHPAPKTHKNPESGQKRGYHPC